MVTTLQDVWNEYQQDLDLLEQRIRESLHSDVPLIREVGDYILSAGGKRFRPLLLLLSARLCGSRGNGQEYLLGSVVEFIHTASLLHDDVVDEAKLRRGRSTANSLWGNQASILVGDYLYSKALYLAVRLENQRVMDVLSETTTIMSEGEVLQLMQVQNAALTETDYFRLVDCKTGVLITAACRLGAIVNGSPAEQENALAVYGSRLGLAFQITDDTLDYTADQGQLGKVLGKDLAEGKVTLPLIYLLGKAEPVERERLQAIISAETITEGDLAETLRLMARHGAVEDALRIARSLADEAKNALAIFPDSAPRRSLLALADFVVRREM